MAQFWTNTSGATVPTFTAAPGQILIVRANAVVKDYSDRKSNQSEYGDGLKDAFAALQANDTLITGPGQFDVEQATITASDVTWIAQSTVLTPATNWDWMVSITGDRVQVDGVKIRCEGLANNQEGVGWTITGDDCRLTNCEASGTRGGEATPWALEIFGDGCYVEGFWSNDTGSFGGTGGGIRIGADRCHVNGAFIRNSGNRSFNIEGSGTYQSLHISNCQCISDTSTTNAQINFNVSGVLESATFRNVTVWNKDNIAPGVSYDVAGTRTQIVKFQNISRLLLESCNFLHGSNQGAGGRSPSIAYDAGLNHFTMRSCTLSDGFTVGAGKFGTLIIEDCDIGKDSGATSSYSSLIRRVDAKHLIVRRNRFRLPPSVVTQAIEFSEAALQPAATDLYVIEDNEFYANDTSTKRLNAETEIVTTPRKIICAGNRFINDGTGTFIASSDDVANLLLTTDRDGNLLFDDSLIGSGMPDPGTGPNFFSSVPGTFVGQRIFNTRWTPAATNVTPQQSWIWTGTLWKNAGLPRVSNSTTLVNATPKAFVDVSMPALSGFGGSLEYACVVKDGTDVQVRSGVVALSAVAKASNEIGAFGTDATSVLRETAGSSTLAVNLSATGVGGDVIQLFAEAVSSLIPTSITFYYSLNLSGDHTQIAPQ